MTEELRGLFDHNPTEDNIVYVKSVLVSELPDDLRAQAGELSEIYAVHNADGDRLALVSDRTLAFVVARQNDMAPVSVH